MAKTHSSLTTSDLHHPKGFSVESTASMFVMSQSISTATASFHFIPGSNDTYTLGNTARAWKELYVSTGSIHFMEKDGTIARTLDVDSTGFGFGGGDVSGSTISGSKLHIVGDTFIGGDLTLGDAGSDSISIGADITSNLTPNTDNTYDLGTSAKEWKDLYIDGIGYIDQLGTDADPVAAYINAGEIDGTVIGGESAAAATVTTFNLTSIGGNWTNAGNTIANLGTVSAATSITSTDLIGTNIDGILGADTARAITGTTIDATTDFTVGSLVITDDSVVMTPSTSDTVTIAGATHGILNITTVDDAGTAGDINVTADGQIEFRANDAAGHIFDIAGTNQVTITDGLIAPVTNNDIDLGTDALEFKDIWIDGTANLDTVDIDAGAIDGVTIGGASAGAGTFTNLTVTTDVDIDDSSGDGAMDGVVIGASTAVSATFTTLNTTGLTAFAGAVTLGDATGDDITITGRIAADIDPKTDNTYDLGASGLEWKDIHIDGVAYIDTLNADALGANLDHGNFNSTNVDINSGAIDGTIIGANSAAAGTFGAIVGTSLNVSEGNITNVSDIALDTISADDGSSLSFSNNWTNAGRTVADLGIVTTVDINGGSVDGATIGAASHTTIKGTTIDATTDFTIDGLVLTADTITNDSNLTMDLAGDLAIDVDGGDVTITDNGADILTINATTISGSATSSGSFAHIAVNSVSASRMEIDSIQGNWTNAGNTVADLGSITTVDINGGTINGITDLAVTDGGTGQSNLNDLITLGAHTTGNYVAAITSGTGLSGGVSSEGATSTLSVDAAQTQITSVGTIGTGTWEATDVAVAHGGTGVSTLTDGGILLGSGTSAVTATAVLADGEILIGDGTTDPVALDVGGSGAITILGTIATGVWQGTTVAVNQGGTGVTSSTGTTNVVLSGSPTIVTPTIASFANATHTHANAAGGGVIALGTATSGHYVATITGGTGITSTAGTTGEGTTHSLSVDAAQTQITSVGTIGTGVWQGTAINDTYIDTINNANKVALTALDIDGGTDVGAAIVDADLMILDDGAGGTNRKATMSRLKTYMSGVSGGSTLGNVQVGVTAATEIDTTSGNLIIDSAGGTTTLDDHVIISGNLTVSGTETIIDSTRLDIGDKIIELNAAGSDGGIYVKETSGGNATGSMLWDVSANRWFAGLAGSEANVVLVDTSDTLTNKTLTTPVIGSFANAGHTHANSAGGGQITLGTGTTGNYVATAVAGTAISVSGATGNVTIANTGVTSNVAGAGIDVSGATGAVTISIGTGEVVNAMIGDDEINSEHYAAGSIDNEHIADDAIDSEHYAAGSIDTAHIAADQITAALIADDQINSEHYVAGSIDNEHIADDAINSEHYAALSIDLGHLAADSVDGSKIVDDAINSEHYTDGSIDNAHIADDAIDSEHYAALSIDLGHLAADSVDGSKIVDDAINSEHYAAASIDTAHIAADNITGALIADSEINSEHYVDASIDDEHLSDGVATGLAGAGMTATSGVLNVIGGTGITANADNITTTDGDIVHDNLSGFVADEHIAHSGVSISAGGILSGGGTIAASRTITLASSGVDHDATTNFVANEHIDHTGVTLTAGTGLNGGGTIAASRTFTVDAAQTVITSIYATDLIMGEDDETNIDFGIANNISFNTNDAEDFRMVPGGTFHANADVVAYSSTVASDMALKENITDTKYGLSDIMKLRGVDFDWKREDMGHSVGVLAQEVEAIIPEIVKEHDGLNGRPRFKSVDYNKLVPVLIESIKELKKEIDDLKSN